MDLQSVLQNVISGQVVEKISKKTGLDDGQVEQVISAGLPILVGALAKNTTDRSGADALDAAITKDHTSDALMESLGSLFSGGDSNGDGEKILGHVFGGNTDTVASKVAKKSGVDTARIVKVLSFVAPLVLAQLGKQKTSDNLNADGIGDLLQRQTDTNGNLLMDLATKALDKNKDGSILDDILNIFRK
jgi:hypothetical protein